MLFRSFALLLFSPPPASPLLLGFSLGRRHWTDPGTFLRLGLVQVLVWRQRQHGREEKGRFRGEEKGWVGEKSEKKYEEDLERQEK